MIKNTANQKWTVFAFDATTGLPATGDAANITANLRLDGGAANAVDDTNPTELEDGYYVFDITQAETNADHIIICPQSSTSDIVVIGVPGAVWTTPAKQAATLAAADVSGNLPVNVTQWKGSTAPDNTGDAFARLGTNGAGLSALPWNSAWDAEVQSECTDALNAYDPPTNAEMNARTLASASYATPTNITAGTITTVTNLTNAPTTGDFTTAMKTALNNATPALSSTGVSAIVTAVWSAGTRTLSSFGSLANDVRDAVWGAATRTLTAISDSAGVTTLLSRISEALSFTSGNVHTHIKAKDNLDFGALEKTSLNAATPIVTVSDKTGFSLATAPPTTAQIVTAIEGAGTKITAIKDVTDKLDDTLEDDNNTYRFTEDALAEAPTGGSAPTVSEIWSHETRTLSSFGTLVADIWSTATRTLTTFTDSSGVTTLLTRIGAALSFTSGNVNVHIKGKDNLDFGALEKTSLNAATPAVTVSDKTNFALTSDYDAAKTAASQTSVNGIPAAILVTPAQKLVTNEDGSVNAQASVDTEAIAEAVVDALEDAGLPTVSAVVNGIMDEPKGAHTGLLAGIDGIKAKTDNLPASPAAAGDAMTLTSAYDAAKAAASQTSVNAIPTNPLLTNDARLNNLDTTISSRLATTGYTPPPTAANIRSEIDTNSTKLDVAIGTRLAALNYIAPNNTDIGNIKTVTDKLDDTLELDSGAYKFTEASLVDAPTGSDSITVEDIVDGVLDAKLSDHEEVGSVGVGIAAAGSAGDPWATELPGSYGTNTAGKIVGDNINATIASRLASVSYVTPPSASDIRSELDLNSTKLDVAIGTRLAAVNYTAPANADIAAVKNVTDKLDDTLELADGKNRFTADALAEGPAADVSAVVDDLVRGFLDAQLSGHDDVGSVGAAIAASSASGDPWATPLPGAYGLGSAGRIIGDTLVNAAIIGDRPPAASWPLPEDYVAEIRRRLAELLTRK